MNRFIKPVFNTYQESKKEPLEDFRTIVDELIYQTKSKALKGNIEVQNVTDLQKLMNVLILLEEKESMQEKPDEFKVNLSELIAEDDPSMKHIYDILFHALNDSNDEENRSGV